MLQTQNPMRETRFERATPCMARRYSAVELLPHNTDAAGGSRTLMGVGPPGFKPGASDRFHHRRKTANAPGAIRTLTGMVLSHVPLPCWDTEADFRKRMPLERFERSLSRPSSASLCRIGVQRRVFHPHAPGASRTLTDAGLSRVPLPDWDTEARFVAIVLPRVELGSDGYQPAALPLC